MPEKSDIKADKPPSNLPYVIALVVMAAFGMIAAVAITVFRPDQDNTALITIVFAFIVTITGFVMQFMKTEETHQAVNSRMGELLQLTKKEGVEEGQRKDNIDKQPRPPMKE